MNELYGRLGELHFRSRGKARLNDISGHKHRTHSPPASAAHISGLKPVRRNDEAYDGAVFAVVTQSTDDRLGVGPHPRG